MRRARAGICYRPPVIARPPIPGLASPPAALLFDLDGTLLDSAPGIARAVNAARGELGLDPLPVEAVAPAIGGGLGRLLRRCLPPEAHAEVDRLRPVFHAAYRAGALDARPFPGAAAVVARLGHRSGLVSNKPRAYLAPLLAHLGWRFAVVVDGDGPRKPSPEPLLRAAAALGHPPSRALFVGDSEIDRAAAAAAGMMFATVPWSALDAPRLPSLEALCNSA